MLFDLRGRGRRRTVQGLYLFLALLMAGGLIFFGVGSGSSGGGLLNSITSGGGQANGLATYDNNIKTALKQTQRTPNDPGSWLALTKAEYTLATVADYNQNTGAFTSKGRQIMAQAQQSWNHYLSLNPKNPDSATAADMAFALVAIGQLGAATRAQEIVVSANPTYSQFATLAAYAYYARQTDKGDLAEAKAVSLAPKAQQTTLKQRLAAIKAQAQTASTQQAQQQLGSGGAQLPSG